eukprot:1402240-Amphidinium_carterae.1
MTITPGRCASLDSKCNNLHGNLNIIFDNTSFLGVERMYLCRILPLLATRLPGNHMGSCVNHSAVWSNGSRLTYDCCQALASLCLPVQAVRVEILGSSV